MLNFSIRDACTGSQFVHAVSHGPTQSGKHRSPNHELHVCHKGSTVPYMFSSLSHDSRLSNSAVTKSHKFMGSLSFRIPLKNNQNQHIDRVPPMNPEALNNNQTMNNANQIPPSKNRSDPLIFIHAPQIHKFMGSLSNRIPFTKPSTSTHSLTLAAKVPPMNPEALNNNQTMNNASDPLIFIHGQAFHSTLLIPHLILDASQIHSIWSTDCIFYNFPCKEFINGRAMGKFEISRRNKRNLVDPATSHMFVSKTK